MKDKSLSPGELAFVISFASVLAFLIVAIPFTKAWYEHTDWVQGKVLETAIERQMRTPSWRFSSAEMAPDELRRLALESLRVEMYLFRLGPIRDLSQTYKNELGTLVGMLNQMNANVEQVDEQIAKIRQARLALLQEIDYFVNHQLYAMRYTF